MLFLLCVSRVLTIVFFFFKKKETFVLLFLRMNITISIFVTGTTYRGRSDDNNYNHK